MLELKVAAIQTSPVFGDIQGNLERAIGFIPDDCELAVLPELFATGYQFHSREEALTVAEDILESSGDNPICDYVASVARARKITIVAGLAERSGSALYNSSVLFRPDGTREVYRKVHLFLDEKSIFDPGDLGFPVFEACGTTIGMMICFDWIFPEAARSLALGGAEVLCHPSNLLLPWCPAAMVTRCQENRVFALTSNRIGRENRTGSPLDFNGMSQIVGPTGDVLVRLGGDEEGVASATLRIIEQDKLMTPRNDLWEDRRPDQYRT
jgi:predicted amidohydrolase